MLGRNSAIVFRKICLNCKKEIIKPYNYSNKQWNNRLYCSIQCSSSCLFRRNKLREISLKNGNKPPKRFKDIYPKDIKEKIKISNALTGMKRSEKFKNKLRNRIISEYTKNKISQSILLRNGRKEPLRKDERNDPAYGVWVKKVKKRDGDCRLKDENCF